ncbi:MAG TPA: hypothetical protein VFC17_10550 [Candidatus Limnocylindrales bacterium]|nr:hypothetical protein [Candidatus Limnocylindrales bacterium]
MSISKHVLKNRLAEGFRPKQIAIESETPIDLVVQQIIEAIDKKEVKRSQVLTALAQEWQDQILLFFPKFKKRPEFVHEMLKASNLDDFDLEVEEVRLYLHCFERGFTDGQIYEAVCEIERTLHAKIKQILIEKYGAEENGWWRKGIPLDVRQYCVELREKDEDSVGNLPYSFTTFGHLQKILQFEENPALIKNRLPLGANDKAPNMRVIIKQLMRLTKIRNRVMHPIGATPPTEEDFFFVKQMQANFELTKWR